MAFPPSAPVPPSSPRIALPPLPEPVALAATQYQLGALTAVYPAQKTARAVFWGIGLIVFGIALLIFERGILQLQGTDVFHDFFISTCGLILLIYQSVRHRGQLVAVFQGGLVIYSGARQAIPLRWEDIDVQRTKYASSRIEVVARNGVRTVLYSNLVGFSSLKTLLLQRAGQPLASPPSLPTPGYSPPVPSYYGPSTPYSSS